MTFLPNQTRRTWCIRESKEHHNSEQGTKRHVHAKRDNIKGKIESAPEN